MNLLVVGIGLLVVAQIDTVRNRVKEYEHFYLNRSMKLIGVGCLIAGLMHLLGGSGC